MRLERLVSSGNMTLPCKRPSCCRTYTAGPSAFGCVESAVALSSLDCTGSGFCFGLFSDPFLDLRLSLLKKLLIS
jgi:hypothetical protein